MMETMIPPQAGLRLRTKKKKEKEKKKKKEKKERQREKGHANSTLVLQSSTMFFIQRVSYVVTFIYQWEFLIIALDAQPLSFGLSFHTLIALSASIAWQSLLLALISIDGHLHSPLISCFDVRLSSFLSSLYVTPKMQSYPY